MELAHPTHEAPALWSLFASAVRSFVFEHEDRTAFHQSGHDANHDANHDASRDASRDGARDGSRVRQTPVSAEDSALMTQVGKGDARAYRALVERHLLGIVRYATRMLGSQAEGEDVAQETFLRLWRDAPRYEARGHAPSTWLYRIAHNLCIDRMRKRKPERPELAAEPASSDRTSSPLADKELASQVSEALAELPERQRAAIALVHYEGKSLEETGQVLGCPASAVESLLSRGRRTLREKLSAYYRGSTEP